MPVHNAEIIDGFNEMADLLEIEGANQFRVRAYRNAARIIASLPQSVAEMVGRNEDLTQFPGIGKDLANKIVQMVKTGTFPELKELEGRMPGELGKLMRVAGLGPKRVHALYETLGISTMKQLKEAASKGAISELPGFGKKTEQAILEELGGTTEEGTEGKKERVKLPVAEEIAESLVHYLKAVKGIQNIEVAGSYRRKKETVGDLDILATCSAECPIMEHFTQYEDVKKVISHGSTRSSVILRSGLQVDLRLVPQVSYGAALHYFTGCKEHNIAIRKLGMKSGLKINEYGVFKNDKQIAGKTEEEVYRQVGLAYIEPELRENWGEIEAAREGHLPRLVEQKHIKGDLHTHTKETTDGRNTPLEMAEAAARLGYAYIAITDHTQRLAMTRGFDAARLATRNQEIDQLNRKLKSIHILKSIEVDIHEDGSLDLPDSILKELDITVCSIHSRFNLPKSKQTERILKAMENPYFHILAHPTGRLIDERQPYDVDMEQLMKAARAKGCFMEVNGNPDRLDLSDRFCKMAKDFGVHVSISTDAHSRTDLLFMRFGVAQARRGWLEANDVINTRSWADVKKLLRSR